MAGRLGARLRLGIVTAALLASSGVVYYAAVYVPRRDAALESERMLKQARADADTTAAIIVAVDPLPLVPPTWNVG